jgi:hypothetical protein
LVVIGMLSPNSHFERHPPAYSPPIKTVSPSIEPPLPVVPEPEIPKGDCAPSPAAPVPLEKTQEGDAEDAERPREQVVRAGTLLRTAENLERMKKPAGALDFYRMMLRDCPDVPQAKIAIDRLQASGANSSLPVLQGPIGEAATTSRGHGSSLSHAPAYEPSYIAPAMPLNGGINNHGRTPWY